MSVEMESDFDIQLSEELRKRIEAKPTEEELALAGVSDASQLVSGNDFVFRGSVNKEGSSVRLTPAYLTFDLPVPVPRYSQSGPRP